MEGIIWHLYPRQEKGMIRGDDGLQLPFRKSALNGVEFDALFSGQKVSYRVQEGWLGNEAVEVRPLPVERAAKKDRNEMANSRFVVKIQAGDECISVPGEGAIISPNGLFMRDLRLPFGTAVIVQVCKAQDEVTLSGTVRTRNGDSGLAIEFTDKTEKVVRKLVALLAA
ncbi:MAG: hypothetical protein AAB393_18750 [Bacteroidota bacterium]